MLLASGYTEFVFDQANRAKAQGIEDNKARNKK